MENWKPVFGFEEFYDVSNLGRVRRTTKIIVGSSTYPGRIMSPFICKNGYYRVIFSTKGKITKHNVHRLVAKTFLPIPSLERNQVNHKNGNKSDNRIDNLEWCTSKENHKHAIETGLRKNYIGVLHFRAKLNPEKVREIRKLRKNGWTTILLAEKYNMTTPSISYLCNGKTWKHVV